MLFPGWHAMKNLLRFPMKISLKSFENPMNLPLINSQDFHGFLVNSAATKQCSNHQGDTTSWVEKVYSQIKCGLFTHQRKQFTLASKNHSSKTC